MNVELPIPDYEHLPFGSLVSRVRTLDLGQVGTLLEHERAHGDRLPVVQLLEQRRDALQSGAAAPSTRTP